MLSPDQERILKGATYWVGARLAQSRREPEEWSISLLLEIHRGLFGRLFPTQAGTLRLVEVSFRGHPIATPGQIQYRLNDIVNEARAIIEQACSLDDEAQRIETAFTRIAQIHAECVVAQPFIDGNKRWARQVLSALLVDCGFWPGSRIDADEREHYLDSIDKSISGDCDQLVAMIYAGWLRLEQDFLTGNY